MRKCVIFDLDGTLTRSEEGIWNCVRYAAEKLGFPVPVRDWLRQEPYTSRVRAAFARPAAAQFFRPQVLHSMLNRHLHGGDCWRQIWCVYSFLIWYEQFFGA